MVGETYDLLISGGTVIDPGAGRNERADLAISGGKIAAVGQQLPGRATRASHSPDGADPDWSTSALSQ